MDFTSFGRIVAILVALGIASLSAAQTDASSVIATQIPNPEAPAAWKKETFTIPIVATPPRIDGHLDDLCWRSALHAAGFYRFHSADPVREQTEAWLCADKTHLYVAFHCRDSHPELIKEAETQREGNIFSDDYVLIAIYSQGTRRNVSQFNISARGTQVTQIEGGTADNLGWAGDWQAATQRVADGWTAEISIPFSLLRYPKGTRSFPIALLRQLARETNAEIWPYIPPEGTVNPMPYLQDFVGVQPPYYPPKLVFLPYTLGSSGGGTTSLREGADIKYPITTGLTGVATIHPDFATVEDAVQNLSFSYTEKFLPDHRPFFAEGNGFWPDSFLFYSQRIGAVDEGAKIVGKEGNTTIGVLGTTAADNAAGQGQSSFVAKIAQDFGALNQIGATVLANNQEGEAANRVAQLNGQYGWMHGSRQWVVQSNFTGSWLAGGPADNNGWIQFSTDGGPGKIAANVSYAETGANFTNELGLVPEVDVKGSNFNIYRYDNFDKGAVERDYFSINGNYNDHVTGGFFHDSLQFANSVNLRNGAYYELDVDAGRREDFKDDTVYATVGWEQKTLFQRGSVHFEEGHRENSPYQLWTYSQGLLLTKRFSFTAGVSRVEVGGEIDTQTILSTTYRLNPHESFGARLVQQDGSYNLYFSYGRHSRHGADLFILLGDPNALTTRGVVTVKLVRAF